MKLSIRCGVLCLILWPNNGSGREAQPTTNPRLILHQLYEASGGGAWARVAGAELSGAYTSGGLTGTFKKSIDFRNGRDVIGYDVGLTRGAEANTPDHGWWTDEKGLPTIQDAPEAKADAATQSYEDRNGWFYTDPAVTTSDGSIEIENNRTFQLVAVRPPGGRVLTLWIDANTYRLDRVVERDAQQRDRTTFFSDYREQDGIWFPFRQRRSTGAVENDVTMAVSRLTLQRSVSDADFSPPASVIRDARILHKQTCTVPFTLRGGVIVVDVSVDGKAPLPFVLDSGGLNLLTPDAAMKLGASSQGNVGGSGVGTGAFTAHFAEITRYQVGLAELRNQQFLVVPLPRVFVDRGVKPPIAGLIGYQMFRRFLVTIDYHRRQLTLAMPSSHGLGVRLPMFFDTRTPFVKASIDGVEGYFGIDTGDDGAITLFNGFYQAHHFAVERPGIESAEGGMGGDTSTILTRVGSLALGGAVIARPVTELNTAGAGAFASDLVAGNLGSQVLQKFVLTFDYEHRTLYARKSPNFGVAMAYNRSGLHLDLDDAGDVVVKAVNPGSPAADAGLQGGDRISAIGAKTARSTGVVAMQAQLSRPAGTRLRVGLIRDGVRKTAVITLRELLPPDAP